jgi:hypothetical protein
VSSDQQLCGVHSDPKKLPGQHRALAAYVLLDLLKMRENAPPREVEGACQSWMASKKEPVNSSGQLGAVGGQTSLPSGFRDDGSRPSKIVRLFAPQQLQGLDTLELMWPPCVIVRVRQHYGYPALRSCMHSSTLVFLPCQ